MLTLTQRLVGEGDAACILAGVEVPGASDYHLQPFRRERDFGAAA